MENFFVDDKFYSEIEDLIGDLEDDYGENLVDMDDDFVIECYESTKQKVITLSVDWIVNRINEERLPEEDDERCFNSVVKALETINFEEVNKLMPELYYGSRKKFQLTKQDLLDAL